MSGRRARSNGSEPGTSAARPAHGRGAEGGHRRELSDKGFVVTQIDKLLNWARTGSLWPMTFGLGLLRRRDDARRRQPLRPRPLRRRVPAEPAPVRRDDRRRHAVQQDGAGAAQGLRPDGRAALGDLHGLLRQWRRLLPLFLFGGARLRPHRAGRYLRAGLPADGRGAALRHPAAAEEDPPHRHDRCVAEVQPNDRWTKKLGDTSPGRRGPSVAKRGRSSAS